MFHFMASFLHENQTIYFAGINISQDKTDCLNSKTCICILRCVQGREWQKAGRDPRDGRGHFFLSTHNPGGYMKAS